MSTGIPKSANARAYTCSQVGSGCMSVSPTSRKTARRGGRLGGGVALGLARVAGGELGRVPIGVIFQGQGAIRAVQDLVLAIGRDLQYPVRVHGAVAALLGVEPLFDQLLR